MTKLAFCEYYNMVAILEKTEHNTDFHQIEASQSKALSLVVDETAPPTRGDKYGEAFPTATSLDAGHDRENIPKTSAMPHESFPRVTSLGGDEGDAKKDSSRSTDKRSESTGDLANVLSYMGAANILASGGLKKVFTTASPQVPC
ncbi:hypothetical protein Tco_1375091 [Tanacetum coccineum]